jgi:hypothetical protein
MRNVLDRVRDRVLPAVVTAIGITFIAAGLLTYTNPATASIPEPSPSPTSVSLPSPSPSPSTSPELSPALSPELSPALSPSPTTVEPSPSPTVPGDRVATRVVVPFLRIDLPVIKPPGGANAYPLCDVAMYIKELRQPGMPGATYLYAHARAGMFLPILNASRVNNGRSMLGKLVEVFTNDGKLFLYEITEVRRHVTTLDPAFEETEEVLYLQTSEGPKGTPGKTQVVARPISIDVASHEEANPKPKPVACG